MSHTKYRWMLHLENAVPPADQLYAKKYIISGRVQKVGYRKWITRKAREKKLHGYTQNLPNGKVEVLVASPEEHIVNDFKNVCLQGPKRADIEGIREVEWTKPLNVGFEIITKKGKQDIANKENEKKIIELEKDKRELQKLYHQILNSRSWKLTYPIRYVSSLLRNKPKP